MKSRPLRSAPISDEELRHMLRQHEEILLVGPESAWRQVERQVEHLGFGEAFDVSFSQGKRGGIIKVSPVPGSQGPA